MKLVCPKCSQAIAGADIDLAKGLGVCRPCGELVPFPHAFGSFGGGALVPPVAPSTRPLYRPESLRLVERAEKGRYEASMPPRRLAALPMMGFCLFWDTFMAVWYGIAIAGGIWPMALFGLLHLAVGLFITHAALVAFFNTRRLVIEGGTLTWKSGPIPTRGAVSVPLSLVDGFAPHVKTTQKATAYVVALNLGNGTMRELDVDAPDLASAEYVTECFQRAVAEAKGVDALGPYRG